MSSMLDGITHFIIVIAGATMLYVFCTSRIEGYIRAISLQGLCLSLLVLSYSLRYDVFEFVFLLVETLLFKTVVIPVLLFTILRKSGISREIQPYISQFFSLLLAGIILAFGFVIAFWGSGKIGIKQPLVFGISISIVCLSLILILTRKKIVTHILGYIMLENGIFLLALPVAMEMPFLVNLGIFLDIFIGIYMFVIFSNQIQTAYDEDHIDALKNLRD